MSLARGCRPARSTCALATSCSRCCSPDRALENQSDLMHALRGKLDDVTLSVRRDGAEVTLHGNWPAASRVIERQGLWISGALIAESEPMIRGQVQGSPSLMIHYVQDGSAAQAQDLQEYDLVLTANGHPVDSLATLRLGRGAVLYVMDHQRGGFPAAWTPRSARPRSPEPLPLDDPRCRRPVPSAT